MSRAIIALAIAAAVGAAAFTPATAASNRADTQPSIKGANAKVGLNANRAQRFRAWCTRRQGPYRSNITFALREARGCYRT